MFKLTLNERNGCPGPTRTGIRHSFKGSRIGQLYYRAIKIISFYILRISNIQANTFCISCKNSTVNTDNQTSSPLQSVGANHEFRYKVVGPDGDAPSTHRLKADCSTNHELWSRLKIIIFSKNNINFFQLTSFIIPRFLQFGKPKSHLTTRNQTSFGGSMLLLKSRSDGKSAQLPLAHCLSNDFADFSAVASESFVSVEVFRHAITTECDFAIFKLVGLLWVSTPLLLLLLTPTCNSPAS